jgi:hypothetical protein|tara:strand:- start:123 stop:404 length:282 start_codon:yes stop_codon:yes gene_type:complete
MFDFITSNATMLGGIGGGGIVLYILKKIPNESICSVVETTFESLGKCMTLGLGKWSFSKKVWNSQIEPWFIDLIDNVFGSIVRGFIKGLRSDK